MRGATRCEGRKDARAARSSHIRERKFTAYTDRDQLRPRTVCRYSQPPRSSVLRLDSRNGGNVAPELSGADVLSFRESDAPLSLRFTFIAAFDCGSRGSFPVGIGVCRGRNRDRQGSKVRGMLHEVCYFSELRPTNVSCILRACTRGVHTPFGAFERDLFWRPTEAARGCPLLPSRGVVRDLGADFECERDPVVGETGRP